MRFTLASISLGLFTWLSYLVLTGRFPVEDGGSSKTRVLKTVVAELTDLLGPQETALVLLGLGAVLAFGIIAFGPQREA